MIATTLVRLLYTTICAGFCSHLSTSVETHSRSSWLGRYLPFEDCTEGLFLML